MKWRLVAQSGPHALTLSDAFAKEIADDRFDRLDVAVAYVTLQGVKSLELALGGRKQTGRWVIGLDDAISQPEAIDYLTSLDDVQVRLASMSPKRRFHPKLYCSWSSDRSDRCVTMIGSGNMTLNGMLYNGETAAVLIAETRREALALRKQWEVMWDLGKEATKDEIKEYRNAHETARKQRRKIAETGVAPPEPDPNAPVFDGNPATARTAWVEAGSPSAGGRDLELPRDIVPFFKLTTSPTYKTFRTRDGQQFQLTFTERKNNHMWRLMFNRDSIRAAIDRETLRPAAGGNRSDLTVVFEKSFGAADYDVKMIVNGSPGHRQLIDRSRSAGGLFQTRGAGGRNFGLIR